VTIAELGWMRFTTHHDERSLLARCINMAL